MNFSEQSVPLNPVRGLPEPFSGGPLKVRPFRTASVHSALFLVGTVWAGNYTRGRAA